jgi:uncharacterized HAD superfamily protein
MHDSKVKVIYVDMDGVLCNFNKLYVEMFNISPNQTDKKDFGTNFKQLIEADGFAKLEPMPDFWNLIAHLNFFPIPKEILSSTARKEHYEEISRQKAAWLARMGVNYKQNFVPGKHLKAQYATPDSILIDDTIDVIDAWEKAGGIGILHKNAASTIAILSMHV